LLPPAAKLGIGAPIDRAGQSADLHHTATEPVLRTQDGELRNQNLALVNLAFLNPNLRNLRIVPAQDDEAYEAAPRRCDHEAHEQGSEGRSCLKGNIKGNGKGKG
jgi:hypothetical protein